MKYTGPKARIARRLGMNIYGSDKYDKIMQRKPFGPGKNAKFRPGRDSEFAKQLKEKQKARFLYGLSEKQFRLLYDEATTMKGMTGDNLKQLLERRFDNVLYRAGFAVTRTQSRQFASHGLFKIEGHRVTTPSLRVKPGQKIVVRAQSKGSPAFVSILEKNEKNVTPGWLKVDPSKLEIEILALPQASDAEQALDMQQIVEFYSRN